MRRELLTLARGAKQLVVQEALETTSIVSGSYFSSFTPMTNMGASAEGALMMTFLAPPLMCAEACARESGVKMVVVYGILQELGHVARMRTFSIVVKTPVDSTT